MKNLFIILIALFLTSCMTVKRVEKNCDLFAKVCITETETETEIITETKTEIIYRDTIIYVKVPEKTVIKEVPVYIEKGISNSELSVLSVPFARSYAQVVNSRQEHKLVQTDTLLLFKLENSLKTIKTQEKQIKILKEKYVVTVKENTDWAKFCIKVFWGLLGLVIIGIGFIIFKLKTKKLSLFKS